MTANDDDFDFWADRLKIRCGGYNSEIDAQILAVAELVAGDPPMFCNDIAAKLGMTPQHVELIQYILASVVYPVEEHEKHVGERDAFSYGTSPRGLFKGNPRRTEQFLAELRAHIKRESA